MELLYFGYSHLTRSIDQGLAEEGLGRAHHRALYFIARKPDMTVSELLSLLSKTAALCGQDSTDALVLDTVSEIEILTLGMSRKIWQKISLLHTR